VVKKAKELCGLEEEQRKGHMEALLVVPTPFNFITCMCPGYRGFNFFFLIVLRFEFRALHLLGRCSTT
jgi:hypothetical protein